MRKTLNHYLRTGTKIKEADNSYIGEDWQLPTWLRAVHDVTHMALKNARDLKDNMTGEEMVNSDIEKEFIYSQIANLRTLPLPESLKNDINAYLAYIFEVKRSKQNGSSIKSTGGFAVENPNMFISSAEGQTLLDFDTQAALTLYKKVVTKIEQYLHANLPYWKYDERLTDYGFTPAYVTGVQAQDMANHIVPMD